MPTRGRKFGNETVDVLNKGCLENYDTLACARSGLLTALAAITLVLVVLKIVKYHVYRHPQVHHYAIFYVSAVECLVCGTSFLVSGQYPQLEFSACFLKLLQFTVICHLHWGLAARTLRKEDLVQHAVNPLLCLYVLYCTTVALMGMVDVTSTWTECMRPYWLMLSCGDLALVQLFAAAAVYIAHRTEGLSSLTCRKSPQHSDLWCVIAAYQVSAVLSVAWDLVARYAGCEEEGCSALFLHSQYLYSGVMTIFVTAKFLLPMWTVLRVLGPIEGHAELPLPATYSPDVSLDPSIRGHHRYRRMFLPCGDPVRESLPPTSEPPLDFTPLPGPVVPYYTRDVPLPRAHGLSTISEESCSPVDTPRPLRSCSGPLRDLGVGVN